MARGDAGIALYMTNSLVLSHAIKMWGNENIKKKYLPKLASLEKAGQVESNIMSSNHLSASKIDKGYALSGTRKSITNKDVLCVLIKN